MKKSIYLIFVKINLGVILTLFVFVNNVYSQWTNNPSVNTPIVNSDLDEFDQETIADGSGGLILVWTVKYTNPITNLITSTVKAKRVSANGITVWGGVSGIDLTSSTLPKSNPKLVSDGDGGAIFCWTNDNAVFAQRVGSNGDLLWGENGVKATIGQPSPLRYYQWWPSIVTDDNGGAIIIWSEVIFDDRLLQEEGWKYIYAQRFDATGTKLWGDSGKEVSNLFLFSSITKYIFSDNNGNYTVVKANETMDPLIRVEGYYMQKINLNGEKQFSDEVKLFTLPTGYNLENMVSDGNGGLNSIISFSDLNTNTNSLYLQKHTNTGLPVFSGDYGVNVVEGITGKKINDRIYPSTNLMMDNLGGAIVGWVESSTITQFFAQRFSGDGIKLWNNNNVNIFNNNVNFPVVCNLQSGQEPVRSIIDSDGNFVFLSNSYIKGLKAQKININGETMWSGCGEVVSTTQGDKLGSKLVQTGEKMIAVWSNNTSFMSNSGIPNLDIYAQPLYSNGSLPIKLTTFTAAFKDSKVSLNWQTASETDNQGFDIERSTEGITFSKIGYQNGKGTSNQVSIYNHNDANPPIQSSNLYYRLKQVDTDGGFEYSNTVTVKIPQLNNATFTIYPNPIIGKQFNVNLSGLPKANYQLSISTMAGTSVKKVSLVYKGGNFSQVIDTDLPRGVYIAELTSSLYHQTLKIIVE